VKTRVFRLVFARARVQVLLWLVLTAKWSSFAFIKSTLSLVVSWTRFLSSFISTCLPNVGSGACAHVGIRSILPSLAQLVIVLARAGVVVLLRLVLATEGGCLSLASESR